MSKTTVCPGCGMGVSIPDQTMNVQLGFDLLNEVGGAILKVKLEREDGTLFRAVIWIDGEAEAKELVEAIEKIEASW